MFSNWEAYIEKRFKAQKSIAKILRYHGIDLTVAPWLDPQEIGEFRRNWGETIDEGTRSGVLKLDEQPLGLRTPDGFPVMIFYISTDADKNTISKDAVKAVMVRFLTETTGLAGEQIVNRTELIEGVKCILFSTGNLEGAAKNEILEFNTLLEHPIRHFTVNELQFDPTVVKYSAKSARVLEPAEIRALIERSKGLLIGRNRLVPNFDERLEMINDANERIDFINSTDEEILSKLPTWNSSDPWVKWRGFKIGDVLEVKRRFGMSKITYVRVVLMDRTVNKPPKIKKAMTNK